MSRETIVPAIPDLRGDNAADLLRAIKSTLDVREGRIGNPLDQYVTLRDLTDIGVAALGGTSTLSSGAQVPVVAPGTVDGGYNPVLDYTTPPAPTGLSASAGLSNVYLSWDGAPYRNHAYTEIWRSTTNSLGSALRVGTTVSNTYPDPAAERSTYYYWIRFVSVANVAGPYNATAGTPATTATNPAPVLELLSGQITESQLYATLGGRINLIDGPDTLPGSVNARIGVVQGIVGGLATGLENEVDSRVDGDRAETRRRDALYAAAFAGSGNGYKLFVQESQPIGTQVGDVWSWVDPVTGAVTFKRFSGSSWVDSSSNKRAATYMGPSAAPPTADLVVGDLYFDTDDKKVYVFSGSSWGAKVGAMPDVAALLYSEEVARVDADGVLGRRISTVSATKTRTYYQAAEPTGTTDLPLIEGDLWFDTDDNNSVYRWSGSAWQSGRDGSIAVVDARVTNVEESKIGYCTIGGQATDHTTKQACNAAGGTWSVGLPIATAVKQVAITDGQETLALEQRFTAQKTTNSQLLGQYSVKIDNNGHVSGFGLASSAVNAVPTSAFIVRADRFAIVGPSDTIDPLGTVEPTRQPFVVTTTPTTVGGKTYPAGAWINTAFIANATIGSAQVADLTADKITAGTLSSAMGVTTGKLWGGVAISSNKQDGTFGQLLQPFASSSFGSGFFLGSDSGVYKFYVGSPTQHLRWDGSSMTVRGTVFASAGVFSGEVRAGLGNIGGMAIDTVGLHLGESGSIRGGAMTGPFYPVSGAPGLYLGPEGLRIGNSFSGRFLSVFKNGDVSAPGFTITNGLATFSGTLAAGIVTANTIVSRSATSFEQTSLWADNDVWVSFDFYMDHDGIAAVIASGSWSQSGSGGSYSSYLALGSTSYATSYSGNWYSSAAPNPGTMMISRYLPRGWHSAFVKLQITTANNRHVAYVTVLKSYR